MAHAALDEPDDARTRLAQLEALLAARPELATARARSFLAEAREVVGRARAN